MARRISKETIPSAHSTSLPGILRRRKIPQLMLMVGEEVYYKEKAIEAVIEKVRSEGIEPEVVRLSLADMSTGELAQECTTPDLFGGTRVVVIEGAEAIAEEGTLAAISERIAPNVYLLLWLGKKAKLGELRGQAGNTLIVNCPKVYPDKMPKWLQGHVKSVFGKSLSSKAAVSLVQLAGQNLTELDSQLEKLDLYTGARKSITEEDVRAMIGLAREFATYEIVDAVSQKNSRLALQRMKEAYARGVTLSGMVTWLGGRLRDLLRAKRICATRGENAVAEELGVKPFLARIIAGQAREFDEGEIEHKLSLVLKTQSELRSGAGPEQVLTETLVVRLCTE